MGPSDSASQTASRSDHLFMHSSWQIVPIFYSGFPSPQNCPFPWGIWTNLIHCSLGSPEWPSPQPKCHLDCFSLFCRVHGRALNYPPVGRSGHPANTWFLGPTRVSNQTASRSVQQFLRRSMLWQTDWLTDHATRSVTVGCIYVRRPPRLHANVGPMLVFRVQTKLWFVYTRPAAVRRSCCGMLDCCCKPCIFPTCRRAPSLFANWTCSHGGRFADDRVECTSGVQHWQSDSSDRSVHWIAHLRTQYIGNITLYSVVRMYVMLSQSFVQICLFSSLLYTCNIWCIMFE